MRVLLGGVTKEKKHIEERAKEKKERRKNEICPLLLKEGILLRFPVMLL